MLKFNVGLIRSTIGQWIDHFAQFLIHWLLFDVGFFGSNLGVGQN